MDGESRTVKSLKNAGVNVFFLIIQTILGFWSRKVFYDYLGSEVLGLDTTAASLLNFLNIAESGVGMAVAYFLYTPFYEKDTMKINDLVSLQGWIYRRIAGFILVASFIMMGLFPWIFKDIQIPLWYAYATFTVLLIGNMLGYFVNYRQSVLAADQKQYKVVKVTQASSIAFKVFLILYLPYASHPFLCYLGTTLLGYVIGSIWLNYVLKEEYPWLKSSLKSGKELMEEYPDMFKKIKQLFVHKIGGFVILQCTPLIMYSFSSLTVIAYYGNYLAITDKAKSIMQQAFASTGAAVGNLVASKDKDKMLSVFWELVDSRMCFSTALVMTLALVTEPFISVWLSPDYLLGRGVLYLILVNIWLVLNRTPIDNFKDGFGLFQDVWAPAAESIINLSVAVVCGSFMGIKGVLMGGVASYVVIVYGWKPLFLWKNGFMRNYYSTFLKPFSYRIIVVFILLLMIIPLSGILRFESTSLMEVIIITFIIGIMSTGLVYVVFSALFSGMKSFNDRLKMLIFK
ncbi:MAG: sugar transporter [Bacteroidales bacterium]|nr:sugar transporter [Bacteroidales bacterium]